MSAGQLWSVNSLGGFYYSLNLSDELRMGVQATAKFRQFCDVKDAWGKVTRRGQTFTWDTVPMMARGNRSLTETNTIPQGQHTILQGTLTIDERGYSVPYTEKLEKLSQFSVRAPIMKVLKYDAQCDLDALAHQQFDATPLRYVSSTTGVGVLTTNGTATGTNSQALNTTHVKGIVDTMKERNIPAFERGDYMAIARPTTLRTFKNNLEAIHQYTDSGLTMIMNGEVGRYEGCRFIEQTSVPAGGAADSTTFDPFTDTGDAWNGGYSDWVFFFGEDTVAEAVHTPEEVRAKIPGDFGRSKGVAWYYLGGFGLVNTDATQARIIKWDSAV